MSETQVIYREIEGKFREKIYPTSPITPSSKTEIDRKNELSLFRTEEMKMTTINKTITHERKPEYEAERANPIEEIIATIEDMIADLCPIEETAEAMVDTLQVMNPAVKEVVVFGNVVMIDVAGNIREVNIAGFSVTDLYTTLIAAVLTRG